MSTSTVQAHEAVEYALMEAGALGTETTVHGVVAYFAETPNRERVRNELFEALAHLRAAVVVGARYEPARGGRRDWLEEWKQSWQPVEIGHFIIAPPWSGPRRREQSFSDSHRAGMAFGTGTHETTRLCLDAIQKQLRRW
jgi:ribosomal protein L11 methyltransferase